MNRLSNIKNKSQKNKKKIKLWDNINNIYYFINYNTINKN